MDNLTMDQLLKLREAKRKEVAKEHRKLNKELYHQYGAAVTTVEETEERTLIKHRGISVEIKETRRRRKRIGQPKKITSSPRIRIAAEAIEKAQQAQSCLRDVHRSEIIWIFAKEGTKFKNGSAIDRYGNMSDERLAFYANEE